MDAKTASPAIVAPRPNTANSATTSPSVQPAPQWRTRRPATSTRAPSAAPHHVEANSPVFWFLMQVGMVIGFATAWPANVWLIRRGIKEAM